MAFTVMSDDQVKALLESMNLDDLHDFQHVLASALHEYSTSIQAAEDNLYQQPHRVSTVHSASHATTLYMPSCGPTGMGCKVISLTKSEALEQNPGLAAISPTGVVNLFRPDGSPLGLVHASTLTAFRTALSSACLVSRRNHIKNITVFGSGQQAYWHVRLALMMRGSTVKHVNVVNHRFGSSAGGILKRFAHIPQDVKEREGWAHTKFAMLTPTFHDYHRLLNDYLLESDVIFCCTPSKKDLFDAELLTSYEGRRKGRLIVAIGSYTPEMRELPEPLLLQATKHRHHDKPHRHFHRHAEEGGVIVVDTLDGALKEAGEIIAAHIGPNQLVELGELVMLYRLKVEESEAESTDSESLASQTDSKLDIHDRQPSMSTVFSSNSQGQASSRSSSPSRRSSSQSRKSSFGLPFHRSTTSSSSASEHEKKKKEHEGSLARWLRDGNVIYKSVGLGLMDLVVGMHVVKLAQERGLGTQIPGF